MDAIFAIDDQFVIQAFFSIQHMDVHIKIVPVGEWTIAADVARTHMPFFPGERNYSHRPRIVTSASENHDCIVCGRGKARGHDLGEQFDSHMADSCSAHVWTRRLRPTNTLRRRETIDNLTVFQRVADRGRNKCVCLCLRGGPWAWCA